VGQAIEPILEEFRAEVPAVRRMLERIPDDKLGWKPHPKSRSLGELASHISAIPGMVVPIATLDEFSPSGAPPSSLANAEDIRATFEKNVATAEQTLSGLSDEAAVAMWRFSFRGKEIFRRPRTAAFRINVLNHIYHHRGQLSVYLRLLDIPLPIVYGPTADENPFA
jgi:uncharacterized damage-inducible protein DinB